MRRWQPKAAALQKQSAAALLLLLLPLLSRLEPLVGREGHRGRHPLGYRRTQLPTSPAGWLPRVHCLASAVRLEQHVFLQV